MKKAVVIACLALIACISFAQQKAPPATIKALTDSINVLVQQQPIPGLMVGITTRDSVLFSGGFGFADVEAKRPVTGQTLFRMGSITKMFVSLAILKLVETGKLDLQDELKKVAPEVPFQNPWEATHPVRIVHLLEHTAGFDDMKLNRMCSQDTVAYVGKEAMLLQQPSLVCRWAPGERMAYSNPGYVVLGYIIEKLTGSYYNEFITAQILQPLGMHNSNFNLRSKFPGKDVKQYVVHDGAIKAVPSVTVLMGPAGTLWSSADEMVCFLQFFLREGAPVYAPGLIREMETVHSTLAARAGLTSGYGLANFSMYYYQKYLWRGHGGLMGTCYSTFAYNHELGVGFVISSNGNQQNFRIERLLADYLEQHFQDKHLDTMATDVAAITPYLGRYQFESPRIEMAGFKDRLMNASHVYLENGSLYTSTAMGGRMRLIQTGPLTFAKEWTNTPSVVFTRRADGRHVMIKDGAFFEQASWWKTAFPGWLAATAVLVVLVSVIAAVVSLVGYVVGWVKHQQLLLWLLPVVAVALLAWAVMNLLQVETESYLLSELVHPGARNIIVFTGTLLFGILSLLYLVLVLNRLRRVHYWLASYWMITALSLCYISFVLFRHGWIGLRLWAM